MGGKSLTILSILFVLLWSSGWTVSHDAVAQNSAVNLLSLRYIIVFAVLTVLVIVSGSWRKLHRVHISTHLLIGALSHGIYLLAGVGAFELGASAALIACVAGLQPMTTAILGRDFNGEIITTRQWLGLALGFGAVLLFVSDGLAHGLSGYTIILPLISAVALSIGMLLHRKAEQRNQRSKVKKPPISLLLFLHCTGALGVLLPIQLVQGGGSITLNAEQWMVVLWLALVVSLGAYGLMQLLIRHISAAQMSSLTYLVPPATMLQASLFFGHTLTKMDVTMTTIATVAVFLVMTGAKAPQKTRSGTAAYQSVAKFSGPGVSAALPASGTVRRQLSPNIEL
ncbi:MAG: DMT family transporter [Granulosicoccus sp.]